MQKNKPIKVKSNAKLNLALRITGVRPNGYHNISSIFQEIDLHDIITFSPSENFRIICSNDKVPYDSGNLCHSIYMAMKRYAPHSGDWNIHIQKNISIGSGLGGGSSNAAAVLKFLNKEWEINLGNNELVKLAASIGGDVPFYIKGKTQYVSGIGELLEPIKLPGDFVFLLVCSNIHISTKWAYNQFNLTMTKEEYKFNDLFDSKRVFWELFENQFESVVFQAYPEVGIIKKRLLENGAQYAGLSGSGSTVFGVYRYIEEAKQSQSVFSKYTTYISLPIK
jgi:4-diphosphocytidyl-2-C-methyl-D-erythritol kinase